jgi:glycosyltransferase involved in cell wall biosynthesis
MHIAPRRPGEIASKLRWLLGDPGFRKRLGAAGLERARSRYGWDTVAAQVTDVYGRAVGDSARGTGHLAG